MLHSLDQLHLDIFQAKEEAKVTSGLTCARFNEHPRREREVRDPFIRHRKCLEVLNSLVISIS